MNIAVLWHPEYNVHIPRDSLKAYQTASQFFYSFVFRSSHKHLLGWESTETQTTRFRVFVEECQKYFLPNVHGPLSVFDAGCGYGALFAYLRERGIMWKYTGCDYAEKCIDYAKAHYTQPSAEKKATAKNSADNVPVFFTDNLFEPTFDTAWGMHDVCFLSGVLNLNIDKLQREQSGANYEVTLFIVQKLLKHARLGVVCNFLHTRSPSQDETFFYHTPDDLRAFLEKNNIEVAAMREGYLPNDFTVVVRASQNAEYKPQLSATSRTVHIYTDGGCSRNPGAGAWAFVCPEFEKEQSDFCKHTTNNKMELTAAVSALQWACEKNIKNTDIVIHTDSQYVQKGITEWITKWQKRGWKTASGDGVLNQDLWKALLAQQTQCKKNNVRIHWEWVKGHSGDTYNERCHSLLSERIKKSV